eukprot:3300816-Rhodomonas_salina.1
MELRLSSSVVLRVRCRKPAPLHRNAKSPFSNTANRGCFGNGALGFRQRSATDLEPELGVGLLLYERLDHVR